jgi:hypothetical protein
MRAINVSVFVEVGLKTSVRIVLGDNVASSMTVPFARMARSYRWVLRAVRCHVERTNRLRGVRVTQGRAVLRKPCCNWPKTGVGGLPISALSRIGGNIAKPR